MTIRRSVSVARTAFARVTSTSARPNPMGAKR